MQVDLTATPRKSVVDRTLVSREVSSHVQQHYGRDGG